MHVSPLYNDEQTGLLSRIAAGDTVAFNELYEQTHAIVYTAVYTYVKSEEVAKDLVQELYIRLWRQRHLATEITDIEAYLFVAARNAALGYFRRHTVQQKLLSSLKDSTPVLSDLHEALQTKELQEIVRQAVQALPAQQQQAWLLAYEQELSYQEIADQMQLSRHTVKRHLEIARRFVRDYVNSRTHTMVISAVIAGLATS